MKGVPMSNGHEVSAEAVRQEIQRRVVEALSSDDGEPYSERLEQLAGRMVRGETDRPVRIELTEFIRGQHGARDVIEAIALLSWAEDESLGMPVSLARAVRARLQAESTRT